MLTNMLYYRMSFIGLRMWFVHDCTHNRRS